MRSCWMMGRAAAVAGMLAIAMPAMSVQATAAVVAPAGAVAISGGAKGQNRDGLVQLARRRGGGFRGGGFRGRRFGGGGRRFRRGGRWIGPAIGAGIAGAILGGGYPYYYYDRPYSYGSYYYRPRRSYYGGGARARCAARYRSFRWSDGTFQPYGGVPRRLCPYLR